MRRMRLNLLCTSLFLVTFFSAQKEQTKWYFGDHAALDFQANIPTPILSSSMISGEGCASIADASGNLLFYTDGQTVYNSGDQVMANGSNLLGFMGSVQSSLIVKDLKSSNLYYLFTIDDGGGPLGYSIVDMSLAAGMGSVTVKNVTLQPVVGERLHGVAHCNGRDVWVMTHHNANNNFLAYLLTPNGLQTTPVLSAIGPTLAYVGALKVSPMGNKIGVTDPRSTIIYDFDAATGLVSNPMLLDTNWTYGCEFSPDGSKFYAGLWQTKKIDQWDLCAGSYSAVLASRTTVYTSPQMNFTPGNMQVGPDKKLYVTYDGFLNTISVINFPNLAGSSCSYSPNSVGLGGKIATRSLPNFIVPRQIPQALLSSSIHCGQTSFSYSLPSVPCAAAPYQPTAIKWFFGDSAAKGADISTSQNPVYNYSKNGSYTVSLIISYQCASDTFKHIVSITSLPNPTITGRTKICKKESAVLNVNGANSYTWSTGQTTIITVSPTVTTIYSLTASNNTCQASRMFTVTVNECVGFVNSLKTEQRMYPNPVSDLLMIEGFEDHTFNFTNLLGKSVMTFKINTETDFIDLSELPKGIYFLDTQDGVIRKIIKQ